MTIVHRTPGLIDPRSFTLMGVSVKPGTDHPIGMFGTGLKYAVATLVRMGAEVTIWIGRDKYEFRKTAGIFRGQDIEEIVFYRTRWSALRKQRVALPFTTSYGKFWKAWMALREMHSNTLDEGGETWLHDLELPVVGAEGQTTIVVDHPDYDRAFNEIDDIFLPGASRQLSLEDGVEALEARDPPRLYYRGLRVLDLQKPSLHTYNFVCEMQLTEDRTLYLGDYYARQTLARAVLKSDDEAFIHRIVTADEDHWEYELEFPTYVQPGEAFQRVMSRRTRGYSRSSYGYMAASSSISFGGRRRVAMTMDQIRSVTHQPPWTYDEVDYRIVDSSGDTVLSFPEGVDDDVARVLGLEIIERLGMMPEPELEPEPPEMTDEEAEEIHRTEELLDPTGEGREAHDHEVASQRTDNEVE